jgi:hypothetical protein
VPDHHRSSTPGLLLLSQSSSPPAMSHLSLAHHETSKCNSLHKNKIMVEPPKISRIRIQTEASQLVIIYQTKVLVTWFLNPPPLDEYSDNTNVQNLNFKSKTHEAQLDDQKPKKSSRVSSRRRKTHKSNKNIKTTNQAK